MCKQMVPPIPNIRSTLPTALNCIVAGHWDGLYHDAEGSWSMMRSYFIRSLKGLNEIQIHFNGLRIIELCTLNKFDWQYNLN